MLEPSPSGMTWTPTRLRACASILLFSVVISACDSDPTAEDPVAFVVTAVASPPQGGSIAGGGSYPAGADVILTATPAPGWEFREWTEAGSPVASSSTYSFLIVAHRDLTGHFARVQFSLDIAGAGDGGGTVTSSPAGIACTVSGGSTTGQCSGSFPADTEVALTAEPIDGGTFSGWGGACSGDGVCSLLVSGPLNVVASFASAPAAGVTGYLAPEDFANGRLAFHVPAGPGGRTYLFGVPALSAADWYTRSLYLHELLVQFEVSAVPSVGSTDSPVSVRALPVPEPLPLATWGVPAQGPATSLPSERTFHIWSQKEQLYVPIPGSLAFTGEDFAFYEDPANEVNFSPAEYGALNEILDTHFPRLQQLMGAPTDLDGNGRVVVFISRSMMDHRTFGQAYVDGCHLRVEPGGCVDRGEFVYIASLDHFPHAGRTYLAENYYPRNILHETTHLLQQGHVYRRPGSWAPFSVPAYFGEGQAELMSVKTGLRRGEMWSSVRQSFTHADQTRRSPFFYPYSLGALFYWYLHQTFGDGVSQALIDTAYDYRRQTLGLTQLALGVEEPLLLAMMYASLMFDGTAYGEKHGLEFPEDDVQSNLAGTALPVVSFPLGGSVTAIRSFTGGAVFVIEHDQPILIEIQADPERAFIVVAQPEGE